jgi:hypothetical protein
MLYVRDKREGCGGRRSRHYPEERSDEGIAERPPYILPNRREGRLSPTLLNEPHEA